MLEPKSFVLSPKSTINFKINKDLDNLTSTDKCDLIHEAHISLLSARYRKRR